jgi:hypothetical protein
LNRWSRIVFAIAVAGCLAWVAAGLAGREAGRGPEPLAVHTLVAFGATLALLLADLWVVVYLATCTRLARAAGRDLSALGRARRSVYAAAILAVLLAITAFAVAGALYPGRLDPLLHVGLALSALGAQIVFVVLAIRLLRRQEAELRPPS